MIGPKQKKSKRKTAIRSGAWKTKVRKKIHQATQITQCSHCGGNKLTHRVCPHCGWYGGKQIMTVTTGTTDDNLLEA